MQTINTKKTQYKVSDFISWQRSNNLIINPAFQRRSVWKKGAKSFLIDTVVKGLPMPIIILREQKSDLTSLEPKREVVDGQQRIRTIFSYIDQALLKDFNSQLEKFTVYKAHNPDIAEKNFSELDLNIRQQILDYEFSVHILPGNVDDKQVLEIFARLNATGVKLNGQELRNAAFFGEFKSSMYFLASEQLTRWREWKIFTEFEIARMDEVELTSDLVQLIMQGIKTRTQRGLDKLYDENDSTFKEKKEVEKRFRATMDTIDGGLGTDVSKTIFSRKTLFYSLFAIIYNLQFGINSKLGKISQKSIDKLVFQKIKATGESILNKVAPKKFLEASTRRTTNKESRLTLFNFISSKLKK